MKIYSTIKPFAYTCLLLIIGLVMTETNIAQSLHNDSIATGNLPNNPGLSLSNGNEYYQNNLYEKAESYYRNAKELASLQEPELRPKATYNLGNSLYRMGKYEDAATQYSDMGKLGFAAYHNMGNSYLQAQKYKEAIESYKNALKIEPTDQDTKYNLSYALEKLKQEQNQDNNSQNQDNQDNQDKENNKEQDKNNSKENQEGDKDQKQDSSDKGQGDKQDNQNKQEKGQQDQSDNKEQNGKSDKQSNDKEETNPQQQNPLESKAKENNITKEEAMRILQALKNEEKDVQKKVRKMKGKPSKVKKNW